MLAGWWQERPSRCLGEGGGRPNAGFLSLHSTGFSRPLRAGHYRKGPEFRPDGCSHRGGTRGSAPMLLKTSLVVEHC